MNLKIKTILVLMMVGFALLINSCSKKKTTDPTPSTPTATVIINLSTIDGGSVIGANVVLQKQFYSDPTYSETATSSNVVISNIPYGSYSVIVSHDDYLVCNHGPLSVRSQTVNHTVLLTTIISFGSHQWRLLDIQDDRVLIISENILEQRVYHESNTSITWENCTLRQYLNGAFYNTFNESDKERIIEVTNVNLDNQYRGTDGGNDTQDKIFLLSLEEVVQYFGDSGQLGNSYIIIDQYNENRVAYYNESAYQWWLRSPGRYSDCASAVTGGFIDLDGGRIDGGFVGVRPALWLNM